MADPQVPSAQPAGPPPKKTSVLPCIIIGVCVGFGGLFVLGILAAILLPAFAKATERAKVTSCASNLRQLWTIQEVYRSQFGGREKDYPIETGSAFWLKTTQTQPPLIDESELEILLCPVHGKSQIKACDYLGPSGPVKALPGGDAVGADRPGNHRAGGNVIRKSGDVLELSPLDFSSVSGKLSP